MALNISKKTSPQDVDSSAKGDLIVNNGSDIISLPVGSDGQVLLADSAEATGIKWAEFGGLNLTETKVITTATINKTYPGGNFSDDLPGVIDFIGTQEDTVAYVNPTTTNEIDVFVNGVETDVLTNKNYSDSISVPPSPNSIVIDLKRDAYFKLTELGLRAISNRTYTVEYSNNGVDYISAGSDVDSATTLASGGILDAYTVDLFYRYYRISPNSTNSVTEVELFGEIIPDVPTYNIVNEDNNKMLLVPFGNPTTVNMPVGVGANGFTCQVTATTSAALPITITPISGVTFIGQNFTIDNLGEVATIIQASPDTYVVSVSRGKLPLSAKGDLLTHDGTEPVVRTVGADNTVLIADSGEATGVRWDDVSTVVSTPFTSQRLDLSSTLQLTGSNARYLYLSAVGGTQDVILTDPPSTNDYFYIVNRDSNNPIQIKETAAGGVVQTLNNVTPVAQCHYDGTEWQILSFGTI